MRILVTGGNGQLGQALRAVAKPGEGLEWHFFDRAQLDITLEEQVQSLMQFIRPDVVINTAAYTAVDAAESDPDTAMRINRDAVGVLARATAAQEARLMHISTDYIYDNGQCVPYVEDDPLAPRSVYARSKWEGEIQALAHNPATMVLRTSWLYGPVRHNFLNTMLRLGAERSSVRVVYDQVGSPTLTTDLARAVTAMLMRLTREPDLPFGGVFNFSNEGVCSWYDFAEAIFRLRGLSCIVEPIRSAEYPTPAVRPPYSVMDKTRIKETFHLRIAHWQDALRRCLALYPGF